MWIQILKLLFQTDKDCKVTVIFGQKKLLASMNNITISIFPGSPCVFKNIRYQFRHLPQ